MTEPDVTLTDYGLAVECAVLAVLLHRAGDRHEPLRPWFGLFFGSIGVAALTGGTVHGFFLDPETTGARVLWPATLLAIGVTALAAWAIGARIQFSVRLARVITVGAAVGLVAYASVVAAGARVFALAILAYVPPAAFLLAVFLGRYRRTRARPVLVGAVGLAATLVGAPIQQAGIALHPVYFNHNALYHAIQAAALLMFFRGARWFVAESARR